MITDRRALLMGAGAALLASQAWGAAALGDLTLGYWSPEQVRAVLDQTRTVRLAPDLSDLTPGERIAVGKLVEAGKVVQDIYERQQTPDAPGAKADLIALDRKQGHPQRTQDLLTLYRLNRGPIASTLDNKRLPFLPVRPLAPGKGVWPWGIGKAEVEAFLTAHPGEREEILSPLTVVRRANTASVTADQAALARHPALAVLHAGFARRLKALRDKPDPNRLYAVPYAVAFADELGRVYDLLNAAADAVAGDDAEFAGYLRNRARDFLSNDYESGDASWVSGRFRALNAQMGAYETYDDELYGVKAFFSFSVLKMRREASAELRKAVSALQGLEDSLPYEAHKTVRQDIPVGLYDVIADFGQARGGNTASILPNDSLMARRYGRTILMRANIIEAPILFEMSDQGWKAAVADRHAGDYTAEGSLYRTLWHEIGHYLGVDRTIDGRDLDQALQDDADLLEEMKADLVSLFVAQALNKSGYYSDAQLRGVYASGIRRVLQINRPRRDQPYNTMELMQFNIFMAKGLISFDQTTGRIAIDYGRYHAVVGDLLKQLLNIQRQGDKMAADAFIAANTAWTDEVHGRIGKAMAAQSSFRFALFAYQALDGQEPPR
ncbi:hypothetical protein QO010_003609 [Caulobacter ginsengisoli]|uniref:NUDIX hydrolase n=1 Tax=Caulobacter ginsengisoli TaxID=400775 RepID=A0ABU0IUW9_9CAUL|nr:hypothetical protein [Caulobacter ginsengisoli]MDQ0465817.1 hypothetical protein [Caulobacter ginsengisoli]